MSFLEQSSAATVPRAWLVPLRLYGAVVLSTAALIPGGHHDLSLVAAKPLLPAPLVLGLAIIAAIALAAGAGTAVAAAVGIALILIELFAAGNLNRWTPVSTGPFTAVAVVLLLTPALGQAGRVMGVDRLVAIRRGITALDQAPLWALVVTRLYLGGAFLRAASFKIGGEWTAWPRDMAAFVTEQATHSVPLYRVFLTDVVVPHINFFAPAIAIAEMVVGTLLVLGLLTRVAAGVGAFLTANYLLMDASPLYLPNNDATFVLGCVTVMAAAGGRAYGLDILLRRRFSWA